MMKQNMFVADIMKDRLKDWLNLSLYYFGHAAAEIGAAVSS